MRRASPSPTETSRRQEVASRRADGIPIAVLLIEGRVRYAQGRRATVVEEGPLAQYRILLVDDEAGILVAYQRLLRSPTMTVDTAQSIEETEQLLKEHAYHAVIADLRLTGVLGEEGLEIIRYIREHSLDTKVVLVTGYGSPEVMNRAFELGADSYMEKPVRAELLQQTLRNLGVGL